MSTRTSTLTRTWTCVLFDLDGTLMDSAAGITSSLAATFVALGRPVPDQQHLLAYVGPPLVDALMQFEGMSETEAYEALAVYRGIAEQADLHDNAVIPGMKGLLADLQAAGVATAVATSKPETRATRILEHFGLAQYFTIIAGASDDETRSSKQEVVAWALQRLGAEDVDLERVVMVGDRQYDVDGAAMHNVPTIMVEWGYGSPDEARGAISVVHSIDQLRALLVG